MSGHQHCINCLQESDILYQYPCVACGWSPEQHNTSGNYLSPGTILHGQYQIARMLGHGGFGITYLAWDNNLETKLAIKEYYPRDFASRNSNNTEISTFAGDARENFTYGLERFLDEARTLAKFQQHSGIVSVLNVFYGNSTGYMVMEYVDGLTLKEYLVDKDKLSWEQTLQLFMPVMDALRAVHKSGMLHRDISPDNIYLCQDNRVKLLDFGSARFALGGHSRSLSVIVKPGYAPEEQYRTKGKQGSWTDVYSVAASMYRCITGLVPPDALDRLDEDELVRPFKLGIQIPVEAEKVLKSALAIKAENRTQTIEGLQNGLLAHSHIEPDPIVVKPQTKSKPQINTEPVTIIPSAKNSNIPLNNLSTQPILARRGIRLYASLIDQLIMAATFIPGIIVYKYTNEFFGISFITLSYIILCATQIYFLVKNGQSLGKKILNIKIVSIDDGELPSYLKVLFLLRGLVPSLIAAIPYVGPIIWIVDSLYISRDDRRCLHDLIAQTKVIHIANSKG